MPFIYRKAHEVVFKQKLFFLYPLLYWYSQVKPQPAFKIIYFLYSKFVTYKSWLKKLVASISNHHHIHFKYLTILSVIPQQS